MLNSNLFSTYGYKEYEKLLNEMEDSEQKETFEAILEKDFKDSFRDEHQFLNIGDVDRAYRLATRIEMQ